MIMFKRKPIKYRAKSNVKSLIFKVMVDEKYFERR